MQFQYWRIWLNKRRLLDNIFIIPIDTYIQAMHMAIKYSMDDVRNAIVRTVMTSPLTTMSTRIGRLAFMAEFPDRFPGSTPTNLFIEVCSLDYHPTAGDLGPLMAHPGVVALMMQFREVLGNPGRAIWKGCWEGRDWVKDRFKSLGF
jgi:hypothetical protein